ncbi:MAG: hypothetical protein Q4G14_05620 [Paracoccus sp. (in: a-proteobacteria)]|uniref:hypothetical protein n=1 Tax=Paracoccus sp. TaxID=267 RepID=UPI0026E0468D|nr:hypothetical protein [Paracoccus sp. (in: a-proteobacteria)]MDO5612707.1 hypothetical protein [Paracoccus sp. (in: a-proteobacteria)]
MMKSTLLILTLMADDGTRITMSSYDSPDACEGAREVVTQVLADAGQEMLVAMCGETDVRVTPYVHGAPRRAEVNRFRVELPQTGGFTVTPLTDEPCEDAPDADPAVYCTLSAQRVIAGN